MVGCRRPERPLVGCRRPGRPRHFEGSCLVRITRMERVCEVRRAQPALCPSALSLLCASQVWFRDSTGPPRPRGVLSHQARGEEKLSGPVFRCTAVGRGRKNRCGPRSAHNRLQHAGLLMEPHCRLHGQVLTGAQPLPLGPCGPHPICVCWVDCLVPVASWEPLV